MPGLASERAGKCHQAVLETMPYIKTENLVRGWGSLAGDDQ
jgi:hypothetical protein